MSNGTSISRQSAPPERVAVLLPLPLAGTLDYSLPDGVVARPGQIVIVPLNGRDQTGVVWDAQCDETLPFHRLKPVRSVVPGFCLGKSLRQFVDWVAAYTLAPPGDVLAMTLRTPALTPPRSSVGLAKALGPDPAIRLSPARRRVLDCIGDEILSAGDLARRADVSRQVLRGLVTSGLLVVARIPVERPSAGPLLPRSVSDLSAGQLTAAAILVAKTQAECFSVTLLQGATGSGKTEVYFEAVRACVAGGRQVLILLPEIALSNQWLKRFEQRFGVAPAVWHSDLGSRTRQDTWRNVARGDVPVLVGARSALFLPFTNIGLIIVDEEHETAFKQEDGVVYHARDMAVVRGRFCQAAVVLVSATPSLESLVNSEAGRYTRLDLPERFGGASLPSIAALDLRAYPPDPGRFLSPLLLEKIAATLAHGEQTLLFLNRRGYAPLTLCRACGHRVQCPNCTAWLVEHRLRRLLTCHHCGHQLPVPRQCPACATQDSLTPIGPGVERITEEIAAAFPDARRLIMASDTITGPQAAAAAVSAIENREIDVIIGTQIVAKGWHFPYLTLVGVVDADLGLAGGDLRAGERTMQLLHQVAGRAGRAHAPGAVWLQTHQPDHPVIQALIAGDFDGFMREEAAQRQPGHWPPFGRLAALIVSADQADDADRAARLLALAAPRVDGVTVLGPAPAPLAILRGRHRRRLLLRATRETAVQPLLRGWLAKVKVPRGVRIDVDVDPISFL